MKAKKIYKQPAVEVVFIQSQIIATSDPKNTISIKLDTEDIEEEGFAD